MCFLHNFKTVLSYSAATDLFIVDWPRVPLLRRHMNPQSHQHLPFYTNYSVVLDIIKYDCPDRKWWGTYFFSASLSSRKESDVCVDCWQWTPQTCACPAKWVWKWTAPVCSRTKNSVTDQCFFVSVFVRIDRVYYPRTLSNHVIKFVFHHVRAFRFVSSAGFFLITFFRCPWFVHGNV